MPKSGIKILSDTPGTGPALKRGDRVRLIYDIQFNRGDFLVKDQEATWTVGDRNFVAGFRYGLEGIRAGGIHIFVIEMLRLPEYRRTPRSFVTLSMWKCWHSSLEHFFHRA